MLCNLYDLFIIFITLFINNLTVFFLKNGKEHTDRG